MYSRPIHVSKTITNHAPTDKWPPYEVAQIWTKVVGPYPPGEWIQYATWNHLGHPIYGWRNRFRHSSSTPPDGLSGAGLNADRPAFA